MHDLPIRVWYEDTDLAGIVYHANHLKFCERGRSDALRVHGVDQNALRAMGIVFVVRSMECDWLATAKLDDELIVRTSLLSLKRATALLLQEVLKDGVPIFRATVKIAAMTAAGAPTRIPEAGVEALRRLAPPEA